MSQLNKFSLISHRVEVAQFCEKLVNVSAKSITSNLDTLFKIVKGSTKNSLSYKFGSVSTGLQLFSILNYQCLRKKQQTAKNFLQMQQNCQEMMEYGDRKWEKV